MSLSSQSRWELRQEGRRLYLLLSKTYRRFQTVQTRQILANVDGTVMVFVPREMLEELNLQVGQDVLLTSDEGAIRVDPSIPQPSSDAVEFAARFTKEYETAMRNLAQR